MKKSEAMPKCPGCHRWLSGPYPHDHASNSNADGRGYWYYGKCRTAGCPRRGAPQNLDGYKTRKLVEDCTDGKVPR